MTTYHGFVLVDEKTERLQRRESFVPDLDLEDYRSIRTFLARTDLLLMGTSKFPWVVVKLLIFKSIRKDHHALNWWNTVGQQCVDLVDFKSEYIKQFDTKTVEDRVELDHYAEMALFSRHFFEFHRTVILSKLNSNLGLVDNTQKHNQQIKNLYDLGMPVVKYTQSVHAKNMTASLRTNGTFSCTRHSMLRRTKEVRRGKQGAAPVTETSPSATGNWAKPQQGSLMMTCYNSSSPPTIGIERHQYPRRYMGHPLKLHFPEHPLFSLYGKIEFPSAAGSWVNICLRSQSNGNFISRELAKSLNLTSRHTGGKFIVPDNFDKKKQRYVPEDPVDEKVIELTLQVPCVANASGNAQWFTFTAEFFLVRFRPRRVTLGRSWFDKFNAVIVYDNGSCEVGTLKFPPNYDSPQKQSSRYHNVECPGKDSIFDK